MATNIVRPASKVSGAKAFSRRYDTSANHNAAYAAWDAKQEAVMDGVEERAKARAQRTPQDQLLVLESREDHGRSIKERAKLNTLIAQQSTQKAKAA